jgi:RHS repeat-associated protein
MDESVDLSVKVRGGRLEAKRMFVGDSWTWMDDRRLPGAAEIVAQLPPILMRQSFLYAKSAYTAVPLSLMLSFPHHWDPTPVDQVMQQYKHKTYTLTLYQGASAYYWWLEDKRGNWEYYQADGRLARRGNKRGITAYYNHGSNNGTPVTQVYDQSHRLAFTYEYNGGGQITAVYDRTGRRVQYRYTGNQLTEVVDLGGKSTRCEYDASGRMTRKVDAAGRPTLISYDSQGNVTTTVDQKGNGHFFTFNYDANKGSRYAQIRSSSGMVKEVWYDEEGETSRVDINGRTVQTIAKDGLTLIVTDEKGNVTRKERDAWDNVTRIVYPDKSSVSTSYEYRFNQPTRFTDQKGVTHLFEYDSRGNLVRKVEAAGTSAERVFQFEYDAWGQITSATSLADAKTEAATTRFTYDAYGNLASIINPMGETTRFIECDAIGNPLAIEDPKSSVWRFEYDPLGRSKSVADPLGNKTTYAYDGANNRTSVVNALLKKFGLEYDDHNNLIKTVDALNQVHTFEYNTDNLLTRQTDQEGKQRSTVYDNEDRLIRTVDGANNQINYRYDETRATVASSSLPSRIEYPSFARNLYYDCMQRLVREEDVLGEGISQARVSTYDAAGNILSATDPEGKTTRFDYDALNRLVKTTDPAGGIVRQAFDDRDNVLAVEDAKGGLTRYQYDRNNRLTKMTRPLGQETRYEYDAAGNRIAIMDAKGQKIAYEYDAASRLVRTLHFAAGNHTDPIKTVTFTYNALGDLVTWNDGEHSAEYSYDDLRRKIHESVNYGPFTLSCSYSYYANGLKKTFTGPDGIAYEYAYDNNNRLAALNVPGIGAVTWDSYSWNSPTRTSLPGGGHTDFAYDTLMRPKSIVARDPVPATILSRGYQYSPAGNIVSKATEYGTYAYGYDDLYRLTTAANPSSANEAYTYDALGNRTKSAAVTGAWNYNLNNELLAYANVSFIYDSNGNITRKVGDKVVNYIYDVADRLIRVEDGDAVLIASYGYDPFGRRLWKDVNGVRTYFHYSDEGLVGEYAADGAEIKTYGYAPGSAWSSAPMFQKVNGSHYWYLNDHLGTPQKIVDSIGNVVWAGVYDSFGQCQVAVAEIDNNLRFPGQYWDEETGLHYNWNRYYDPVLGRYMTRDPFGDGWNHFVYCYNNPLGQSDPSGTCAAIQSSPPVMLANMLHGIGNDWAGYYGIYAAGGHNPIAAALLASDAELLRILGVMTYLEGGWLGFDTLTGRPLGFGERVERTLLGAAQSVLSVSGLAEGLHAGIAAKSGGGLVGWWNKGSEADAAWRALPIKDKVFYEIGQKTLPASQWKDYAHLDAVARGRALVQDKGWVGALIPQGSGWSLGVGSTLSTGPTPLVRWAAPRVVGAGAAAGAGYYLYDSGN